MRVCEEEESNVIVMGSCLVESMGEGTQATRENGCAMNGVEGFDMQRDVREESVR